MVVVVVVVVVVQAEEDGTVDEHRPWKRKDGMDLKDQIDWMFDPSVSNWKVTMMLMILKLG